MGHELSMDEKFIKKLHDILEANLEDEQFGVSELAEEIGVSRSKLHRKLNALTGKSTSQFIREYRLEKAMDMLQNNVATGSEIAYRVGFGSPTYFNTSFKEYYGYPPGEVKFRDHSSSEDEEDIQLSQDDKQTITIKRKLFKQRTYLIVALAIFVLATFSYYNYSTSSSNTGQPTENKEIIELKENSIAVLPFKNWSGDPDLEYISDGMTDAVISKLSGIKAINKIIPFTSITKYKGTDKDINTIANELEVKYILEGNFKLSGTQVQSNLKLIEARNNKHLWSLEYTGVWNSDEVFELQALIAENVAKEMNAEITDSEFTAIEKMPTKNIEAYDSYLHATYNTLQYNKTAFKNAIPLYERAIQLDPNFTDAYIGFGRHWSYGGLIFGIVNEQEAWNNAKVLFEKALELDPTNGSLAFELHLGYFFYDWNFVAMQEYLKNGDVSFPDFYMKMGNFEELLSFSKNAIEQNSVNSFDYSWYAWSLFLLNDFEKSHEVLATYRDMFDDAHYLMETSRLYYYMGNYKSSIELLDIYMKDFTDRPPLIIWLNAVLSNVNGNGDESQNYLNQLLKQYDDKASGSPAWFIALYYAHIKNFDKAFEWLQKSFDRHEIEMTWLKEEPLLRPLRTDSRYIELYDKVGFSKIVPITAYVE